MVGAFEGDQALRPGRRLEQADALLVGDDSVGGPGEHQQGHGDTPDAFERGPAVVDGPRRHEGQVGPGDVEERGEGGAQHQGGRRPALGEADEHRRPQRLAEVDQAGHSGDGRRGRSAAASASAIRPVLLGLAGLAAVAAVVEGEHPEAAALQPGGQREAVGPVAGVAVAEHDGGVAAARQVPGRQGGPAGGVEGDAADRGRPAGRRAGPGRPGSR